MRFLKSEDSGISREETEIHPRFPLHEGNTRLPEDKHLNSRLRCGGRRSSESVWNLKNLELIVIAPGDFVAPALWLPNLKFRIQGSGIEERADNLKKIPEERADNLKRIQNPDNLQSDWVLCGAPGCPNSPFHSPESSGAYGCPTPKILWRLLAALKQSSEPRIRNQQVVIVAPPAAQSAPGALPDSI